MISNSYHVEKVQERLCFTQVQLSFVLLCLWTLRLGVLFRTEIAQNTSTEQFKETLCTQNEIKIVCPAAAVIEHQELATTLGAIAELPTFAGLTFRPNLSLSYQHSTSWSQGLMCKGGPKLWYSRRIDLVFDIATSASLPIGCGGVLPAQVLIRPCACRGSMTGVHASCLEERLCALQEKNARHTESIKASDSHGLRGPPAP
eukprot:4864726-Amphidinium_carterae.1